MLRILASISISIGFVFLSFLELSAQELTIGAQVRPRGEYRNGFKTLTEKGRDPAFFIEQRTRLWVDFKVDKFRLMINAQDVRIWGAVNQIYKSDPSLFNLYEGWAEYFFNNRFSMRLGRMALDYNNARIMGDLDWAAQGRSHDALLFIYKNETAKIDVHLAGAFNQTTDPAEPARLSSTFYSGVANYKSMQFLWFQKRYNNTDFTLFIQNDGRQSTNPDTTIHWRQTYAALANHNHTKFAVGGEFYVQGGKDLRNEEVSAWAAMAYFTYKTSLTPVIIGVDFLSGSTLNDTKNKSFDPLYGTHHKFYGYMDYFYVGNFHGQGSNPSGLTDIFVKTDWRLTKILNLAGHLHFFNSPATLFDPADGQTEIDRYLGTELDLVLVIKPAKNVKVDIGYSQMFATSSMEAIKNTPGDHTATNNWAWFMIDFKPILFKKDFSEN